MKSYYRLTLFFLIFLSCKNQNSQYISNQINYVEKNNIDDLEKKYWFMKDIEEDSIPGISLERAYRDILGNKVGEEVIVAIIDMEVDIYHEDLYSNIWKNKNEIPSNNIDDDNNGYIDDINGWNFLGNKNKDKNRYVNLETLRILRSDSLTYSDIYDTVKKRYLERLAKEKEDSIYINDVSNFKKNAQLFLSKYFKEKQYNLSDLDSLKLHYPNNKELQKNILRMSNFITYGFTEDYINNYKNEVYEKLDKLLNLNYNDRLIINDIRPNDITYKEYGNNIVNNDFEFLSHGTLVSGVIAGIRDNDIGTKGFSDNIKIMPLCVAAFGDEHDKDIALAIKYAVDNGAKVINMSFGKDFSLHKEWVFDALKYAEERNVIVITSSGNSGLNLNDYNHYYPNDNVNNANEVSGNLIMVGSTNYVATQDLFSTFSNYGNIDVDIFAPGEHIYTTSPSNDNYTYSDGTSMSSAIVSGIAALIYSFHPKLTVSEIKQIIISSGIKYDIRVKVSKKKDKTVPFSQLSKSGKIVNAHNALIMADSISKLK